MTLVFDWRRFIILFVVLISSSSILLFKMWKFVLTIIVIIVWSELKEVLFKLNNALFLAFNLVSKQHCIR